ncbi:DL-glycerol-3-phosphatase [Coemansia spiralis]|uniref:DL-glycerol-3-phosphatase n=2 Tax=Coemansia TaxID=4863 RepID=A0A9W8G594_9FUNG|nr:HAD-like domain-containing protein [Coemansia spiralis]KAJ1991579.1 DL-glycerol-3-phosphatase [Coemansia umbellata]KAJ2623939.1 DL-glycerol-3-phosphatase [Coemansia sp. RSA 1358]KAJ2679273.1 DL-glycerol-3-phosphatase [Coemansia spiralis]
MIDISAQGILFDLDGTLVNTVACVEKWWRKIAAKHNVDGVELLNNIHGHPTYDVLCKWFPKEMHSKDCAQQLEEAVMRDPEGVFAVPGTHELLQALANDKWAIVTAATPILATTRLRQANLPVPDKLVSANDVQKGKPHPSCYQMGAEMLGIAPSSAIVFEDSVNGVKAGVAAGAITVGILTSTTEQKLRAAGAQYVIRDFTSIQIKHNGDGTLHVRFSE